MNGLGSIISNANGAFSGHSPVPETIEIESPSALISSFNIQPSDHYLRSNGTIMSHDNPVPKDTLREDIQDGEEDSLRVDAHLESQGTSSKGTA